MDKVEIMLEAATQQFKELRLALKREVDPAIFSTIATIPYKIILARETLMYRAVDLGEASCMCFKEENIVSGACLSRAFQETIAALFYVNRKSKKAITDKDLNHLNESTMRVLLGSKDDESSPDPVNISTMNKHVEREVPKFKSIYSKLSEIAHPNYHGTAGIYSHFDTERRIAILGNNTRIENITRGKGVSALSAGLKVLKFVYDEFAYFLPQLIQICEDDIKQSGGT